VSEKNIDRYAQVVDAWNRGDIDRLLLFMGERVEVSSFLVTIEGGYRGHEGVRRWWHDFHDMFPDWHAEIEDIRAIDEFILARLRTRGHGRGSGTPVDQVMWHVACWRNGTVFRLSSHRTESEALKAAGLEEQAVSANVDLVRSIYGDWERGDLSSVERADPETVTRVGYEWFNRKKEPPPTWLPDGEFINSREDPDHAVYRGIDAIRKQHLGWFDAYPDLRVEPLEIRANGDLVFVWTRFTGHGADSGVEMKMELAHVVTLEGGKTRRIEEYFDRSEALKAVGLEG
jgi:ketosteroid isomerase-like protein